MNTAFNPTHYQAVLNQCHSVVQDVTVIAVTKYTAVEAMRQAYQQGVRHFGENKIQDLLDKQAEFTAEDYPDLHWHMIGHLQSNKVNKVVGMVSVIHSVDSEKLLKKINDAATRLGIVQPVLLQVNVAEEESKSGFASAEVLSVLNLAKNLGAVHVQGLMTMAPVFSSNADNIHEVEATFSGLQQLRQSLECKAGCELFQLSMGMSGDYHLALQYGATMIRVGSYLFSDR